MNSMTGFASKEITITPFGKICLEIRSTNHKFLEAVFHLPVGFLSLEDKIKKEVEAKIKRGRIVCVMNVLGSPTNSIFIDKRLLKNYISILRNIRELAHIQEGVRLDTLINLPGVLSLTEDRHSKSKIWPRLKTLVRNTLVDLVSMRKKEGQALYIYFKESAQALETNLGIIKTKFKKLIQEKVAELKTPEECSSFLKDTDITEEIERLAFHIRSFQKKLSKSGPIGKELDFIAQEMQREANTMGAKSCDAMVSSRVVQMKSQIEKIREQVQNIE
ncbi:MAG: YicC family protein [Candidatus Omnitrophica bacterium CG23_combo_of_CG06-09_8_20_14_all_40_11]|nr:MAG: YicC family protein [Candidatus Omnitrophica bacterium CG23_combo_of_CG06-09_8_20_14_all_40_11]